MPEMPNFFIVRAEIKFQRDAILEYGDHWQGLQSTFQRGSSSLSAIKTLLLGVPLCLPSASILKTTSIPESTFPKATCLPSNLHYKSICHVRCASHILYWWSLHESGSHEHLSLLQILFQNALNFKFIRYIVHFTCLQPRFEDSEVL